VFELVDRHFAVRAALAAANEQLEQREAQFRSVQKRLLVRYKVRLVRKLFVHCIRLGHNLNFGKV
jgi:hypothetical protein